MKRRAKEPGAPFPLTWEEGVTEFWPFLALALVSGEHQALLHAEPILSSDPQGGATLVALQGECEGNVEDLAGMPVPSHRVMVRVIS